MNTLKQRFGPFPVWVWLVLITALALGWYLYESYRGNTGSSSGASQVPETVNQVTIQQPAPPKEPRPKRKKGTGKKDQPPTGKHHKRKPRKPGKSQPAAGGAGVTHLHPATGHPHATAAAMADASPQAGQQDQPADVMAPDGQGHDGADGQQAA